MSAPFLPAALTRPSSLAASGLVGGFAIGRATGRRDLGGALFAAAGAGCARQWVRSTGAVRGGLLTGLYVGAMAASHPLARKVGAWPSVAMVTGVTVLAAEAARRTR